MKITAHSLKRTIRTVEGFLRSARKEGPDEYGAICLYRKNNSHAGLSVEWIAELIIAAEAQQIALQHLKDSNLP